MKKLALFTVLPVCLFLPTMIGCSGGGNVVMEAPAEAVEEEPAMEGMTDEEYDAAMDAEMDE